MGIKNNYILDYFFWPGMHKDVIKFVRSFYKYQVAEKHRLAQSSTTSCPGCERIFVGFSRHRRSFAQKYKSF